MWIEFENVEGSVFCVRKDHILYLRQVDVKIFKIKLTWGYFTLDKQTAYAVIDKLTGELENE